MLTHCIYFSMGIIAESKPYQTRSQSLTLPEANKAPKK